MLVTVDLMKYMKPIGEFLYHFNVKMADKEALRKAVGLNDSYRDIYGHDIFDNLQEIKKALKHND